MKKQKKSMCHWVKSSGYHKLYYSVVVHRNDLKVGSRRNKVTQFDREKRKEKTSSKSSFLHVQASKIYTNFFFRATCNVNYSLFPFSSKRAVIILCPCLSLDLSFSHQLNDRYFNKTNVTMDCQCVANVSLKYE